MNAILSPTSLKFPLTIPQHRLVFLPRYASSATDKGSFKDKSSQAWWYIARALKLIRIPFLVGSVYYLGYNQGLLDYSRNPVDVRNALLRQMLAGCGCDDVSSQISVIREGERKTQFAKIVLDNTRSTGYGPGANRTIQLGNVALVGERIVNSAKNFVSEEMRKYVEERGRNISNSVDLESTLARDEGYGKWKKAMERMGIESGERWRFILVDVPMQNAFVSEFVPYTIFVTRGILDEIVSNNDELGLILGHEVSHLICGHISAANSTEVKLKILQTLLLSLDPSEGMLSVQINAGIAFLKNLLTLSHSRKNEVEADEMGIKIAAMACFDTKKGPVVMEKLHQAEKMALNQSDTAKTVDFTIFRTHPPSNERFLYLKEASKTENPMKYEHCAHMKEKFREAWRLSSP